MNTAYLLFSFERMPRKKFSAKSKRIDRMRRRVQTPSILPDQKDSFSQCVSPEPVFATALLCETELFSEESTSKLGSLIQEWLTVYSFQREFHNRIIRELVSDNVLSVTHDGYRETIEPGNVSSLFQLESTRGDHLTNLIQSALSAVTPTPLIPHVEAEVVNTTHPEHLEATVDTMGKISLRFKNRGSNSLSVVETYLQEKLDVLDFLQADQQRANKAALPSPTVQPLLLPKRIPVIAPSVCDSENVPPVTHAFSDRDRKWDTGSSPESRGRVLPRRIRSKRRTEQLAVAESSDDAATPVRWFN